MPYQASVSSKFPGVSLTILIGLNEPIGFLYKLDVVTDGLLNKGYITLLTAFLGFAFDFFSSFSILWDSFR